MFGFVFLVFIVFQGAVLFLDSLSVISSCCDRGKRLLRRLPFTSGHLQPIVLPISVQDLIWESGHCAASPSHVSVYYMSPYPIPLL